MGSLRTEASKPTEFRQFSKIDNLFQKKRKQASKVLRRKYSLPLLSPQAKAGQRCKAS